ncbi:MAG: AAA family ATPase, partial [Anaerolineae bacterium]|nr:AAA family ATPase [Anaerolineae bacterium]
MALSNRDRVDQIMFALRDGLGPFILREYRAQYKRQAVDEIDRALQTGSRPALPQEAWSDNGALIADLDTQDCLNLMIRNWQNVFQSKLGHDGRSYAGELLTARNKWAHPKEPFTNDEAYRVADTATRLLKAVGAADDAVAVEEIGRDLLRLRYDEEAKKSKKATGQLAQERGTTTPGLKPWREVVQPHPDVASGRYLQAEFAADLSQVLAGTAEPEYQDPVEFFRRTYLTEGLLALLVTGVRRLTAQPGDPVVQIKTSFGGGKTHSMLALYHLAGPNFNLGDFPGGERLAEEIGNVDLPEANRAVLVGTALDAAKPRVYPDATVNTLWGELAYQLGGLEGYQMVEQADVKGI